MRVHNLDQWYHLALVVLVSACPCALILSTPVATYCALSKAATTGLLVKGAEYLEILSKVKIFAFDKTGTITRGEFSVSNFRSLTDNVNLDKLLYWVSSVESKSSHPMAAALINYAQSHSVESQPDKVEEFENFPGEGIYGRIDGKDVYVGNQKIAIRAGCSTVPRNEDESMEGKSTGYIFVDSSLAGVFSLSDACRTGVKEALKELKSMGIKIAMLTGDCQAAANHAQDQLGGALEMVHAELLPQDKAKIIKDFQKEAPTAVVGDGVNDAPALATADIGISMGISGSALATETGHVILMSNDIRKIPIAVRLARKTRRKIFENIFLAIVTKAAIIALAIAGHPLVWAAVLADVGTCLVVIVNSMLLLRATTISKSVKKHSCSSHHAHKHCHSSHEHVKCSSDKCSDVIKCSSDKCSDVVKCLSDKCSDVIKCSSDKCSDVGEKHDCCGHNDTVHELKHSVQGIEDEHSCCAHFDEEEHVVKPLVLQKEKHGCYAHDEIHAVELKENKNGCCGHARNGSHDVKHLVQARDCNTTKGLDMESHIIRSHSCGNVLKKQGDRCHNQITHKKSHSNHETRSDSNYHHVKEFITEEELGEMVRGCCKNYDLERNVGGCCKSFRKECCRHQQFGVGFNGGAGLSEIVIE